MERGPIECGGQFTAPAYAVARILTIDFLVGEAPVSLGWAHDDETGAARTGRSPPFGLGTLARPQRPNANPMAALPASQPSAASHRVRFQDDCALEEMAAGDRGTARTMSRD